MQKKITPILLFLIATLIFASCAKCPIPSCKTRKYHQHALEFDMKALRKEARRKKINKIKKFFGIKKKLPDSTNTANAAEMDSTLVDDGVDREHDHEGDEEGFDDVGFEGEEEGANDIDLLLEEPMEEPKKKRRRRRKGKGDEDQVDDVSFEDEESFGDEEESKKKKFKWPWQKSEEEKYLGEQEEIEMGDDDTELEEVEGVDEQDFAKEWRSRRWKFWGNQRPKIGQRWKAPKEK